MPRIRFCPHCGKDYPWAHKTCDHCDLPPRTLEHTRREVAGRMAKHEEGLVAWEWVSDGFTSDGEEECSLCAARDGEHFTESQLRALMATTFCLRPFCRCSIGPVLEE